MKFNAWLNKNNPFKLLLPIIMIIMLFAGLIFITPSILQASTSEGETVQLPILMYHGVLKSSKSQGKYVISSDDFEQDLKYITENGYQTILVSDLIRYVYEGAELPPKPIMITFDDGYYNNYLYAYPLLQKYNCKMVISPICKYTEEYSKTEDTNPNYAHVNWDNLNEMIASGLVEVQNHSYNLHKTGKRLGTKKLNGESEEQYKKLLTDDISKAQDAIYEKTGIAPTAFTYPFGAVSKSSIPIIKEMGFKATFYCENKTNHIGRNPEHLFGLCRYLRPGGVSSAQFFKEYKL